MECEKWCAEVWGMVHEWTHTHSHIHAHLLRVFTLSLNCMRRQRSGGRWSHMTREVELCCRHHRPMDYDVSEIQTSILFNYFGLNPPHFKYIYHHLHLLLPRILPSSAKQPIFSTITPMAWFQSSGLSFLYMLYFARMTLKVGSTKWSPLSEVGYV